MSFFGHLHCPLRFISQAKLNQLIQLSFFCRGKYVLSFAYDLFTRYVEVVFVILSVIWNIERSTLSKTWLYFTSVLYCHFLWFFFAIVILIRGSVVQGMYVLTIDQHLIGFIGFRKSYGVTVPYCSMFNLFFRSFNPSPYRGGNQVGPCEKWYHGVVNPVKAGDRIKVRIWPGSVPFTYRHISQMYLNYVHCSRSAGHPITTAVDTSVLPWFLNPKLIIVKRTRKMSWSSRVMGMINGLVVMLMAIANIPVTQGLVVNTKLVCNDVLFSFCYALLSSVLFGLV